MHWYQWLATAVAILLMGCTTPQPKLDTHRRLGPTDLFAAQQSEPVGPKLTIPLTLTFHQNKPEKGFYYLYHNDDPVFGSKVEGEVVAEKDEFDLNSIDVAVLAEFRQRLNPGRLSAFVVAEDLRGPISREWLKAIAMKDDTDLICIFRREIHYAARARFPGLLWNPIGFTLSFFRETNKYAIMIRSEGLLYDRRNDRIHIVKSSPLMEDLAATVWGAVSGSADRELRGMAREGLLEMLRKVDEAIADIGQAPQR